MQAMREYLLITDVSEPRELFKRVFDVSMIPETYGLNGP
jgi:hypothetical protein